MSCHITDLVEARKKGCIKDCRNCGLMINKKCLLKERKNWEAWVKEQRKQFGIILEELDENEKGKLQR